MRVGTRNERFSLLERANFLRQYIYQPVGSLVISRIEPNIFQKNLAIFLRENRSAKSGRKWSWTYCRTTDRIPILLSTRRERWPRLCPNLRRSEKRNDFYLTIQEQQRSGPAMVTGRKFTPSSQKGAREKKSRFRRFRKIESAATCKLQKCTNFLKTECEFPPPSIFVLKFAPWSLTEPDPRALRLCLGKKSTSVG